MIKLIISLFIVLTSTWTFAGESKPYSLKFQQECWLLSGKLVNLSTIFKLKGSKSEKFYSVTCYQDKGLCLGAELHLSDPVVGMLSMNAQIFNPQKINISSNVATIIYNNTTIIIDSSSKTVKMISDFPTSSPPTVETWEGSCE